MAAIRPRVPVGDGSGAPADQQRAGEWAREADARRDRRCRCGLRGSTGPARSLWLSIWDTLKHVFIWIYLFMPFYGRASEEPSFVTSDEFWTFLRVAFVANGLFAAYQYMTGEASDDIAGFFGPGATHGYGYFMILVFLVAHLRGEGLGTLIVIAGTSGLLAVAGESMGFFILLPLWFVVSLRAKTPAPDAPRARSVAARHACSVRRSSSAR